MATPESTSKLLQRLGNSGYAIIPNQPDIRGWNVIDNNGRKAGEVEELIFDTEALKVRYIVLDLEDNSFRIKPKQVLIPIGLIELHSNDDDIILNNVTEEQLRALPAYTNDEVTNELEASILSVFVDNDSTSITNTSNTGIYEQEHFDDNLHRSRTTEIPFNESIRMRQEPSFLESEGTNRMEIDDDIDTLDDKKIIIEERDAIPVSDSREIRSGNDIDEWDSTDNDPHNRE
jgi:sporulation protein YlmC with PRC-barrel domain